MYQYGLMGYLLYSLSCNSILSLLILLLKMFQLWPQEALSAWSQCPLNMIFLDHLLTFWHHKMIQTHLVFFTAGLEAHWFLYWRTVFKNQGLCVKNFALLWRCPCFQSLSMAKATEHITYTTSWKQTHLYFCSTHTCA